MTEAVLQLIAIMALVALIITQELQIYYLKERIERIENWLEAVCKEIVEEIDKNGNEE